MATDKMGSEPRNAGVAGAGPERNLHLDHDSVRSSEPVSRLDAARSTASDTVGAVAEHAGRLADQARETVAGAYDSARERAGDVRERAQGLYADAREGARGAYETGSDHLDRYRSRGRDAAASGRDSAERFIAENPLLVGVVGLAAGLLVGALLPRTRQEDQVVGNWAGEAREQGMRYAREVAQQGRQFVDETVGQVREGIQATRDEVKAEAPDGRRTGAAGRYQNH